VAFRSACGFSLLRRGVLRRLAQLRGELRPAVRRAPANAQTTAGLRAFLIADVLQHGRLAAVALPPLIELDDARVPAGTILKARRDLLKDVLDELRAFAHFAVAIALDL